MQENSASPVKVHISCPIQEAEFNLSLEGLELLLATAALLHASDKKLETLLALLDVWSKLVESLGGSSLLKDLLPQSVTQADPGCKDQKAVKHL